MCEWPLQIVEINPENIGIERSKHMGKKIYLRSVRFLKDSIFLLK